MRAWRCTRADHLTTAFTGEASRLAPGRWHPLGTRIVYASDTPALAALELAFRVGELRTIAEHYVLCPVEVPDDAIHRLAAADLPRDWDVTPFASATQDIGHRWTQEGRSAALLVPSALVPGFTLLLNPSHQDFGRAKQIPAEVSRIAPGRRRATM